MRPYRPTCHSLKVYLAQQETARQERQAVKKGRSRRALLLSSDEARCSVIPLWQMMLGIKGHRPVVGDLDCHELIYVFDALNRMTD